MSNSTDNYEGSDVGHNETADSVGGEDQMSRIEFNIRRNRKFTTSEMRKIFDNFNTKSHIHKGVRLHACGYLLDSLFLLGLTKGVEADFIDYTFLGLRTLLHKPYEKNFEKTHNIKVFSMETITTTELEKTLKISNYEPIEDIGHLFANMSIDAAEKSKYSYIERCNEAVKYKKEYKSEMLRRRKNKIVIDVGNQDLSERCFVLSYNFRRFKDRKNTNTLFEYTKRDAKDILFVLNFLLQSYTEEAVVDAIGISMDTYNEGVTFFKKLIPIFLYDGSDRNDVTINQSHISVINENMDKKVLNKKFYKENNVSFIDVYYEPVEKKMKMFSDKSINEERSISSSLTNGEFESDSISTFSNDLEDNRSESNSINNNVIILEPEQFIGNDFTKMILNMSLKEIISNSEPFENGVILSIKNNNNITYKYKMDISNYKVAMLVRKIITKEKRNKNEKLLIENLFYQGQYMGISNDSLVKSGKNLRARKQVKYVDC